MEAHVWLCGLGKAAAPLQLRCTGGERLRRPDTRKKYAHARENWVLASSFSPNKHSLVAQRSPS